MNWEDIECDKNMKKDFSSTDKAYSQIIEEFAEDHDGWAVHFLDGWDKMVQNGYGSGQLVDGPQSTWLGYDSWTKGEAFQEIRSGAQYFRFCRVTAIFSFLFLKKFSS